MAIPNLVKTGVTFDKAITFIVILFILANIVMIFIEKRDFSQTLFNVGETFFLSTKSLSASSLEIINKGGVIDVSKGFFSSLFLIFKTYSNLFLALLSVIFWINIIAWFIEHSPVSDTSNPFKTYLMAIVLFYFIQLVFILGYSGYKGEIKGLVGDNSVLYYIKLPLFAFWDFLKAIPYLFKPISQVCSQVGGTCKI